MKEEEFTASISYLGLAYSRDFTKQEIMQYYDFLKEYNDITLTQAIKNLIKKSKFLPKITEIIDECEACKYQTRYEVLDYMNNAGYFRVDSEFQKATRYLETGIIPEWFKTDLNKYYKMMKQTRLESTKQVLIGE